MREVLSIDPQKWLHSKPIPISNVGKVLSGFERSKGQKVVKFTGPHTFYRVAGWDETSKQMCDPYGCWWIDEQALKDIYAKIARLDMFEGWMPPEMLQRAQSLPMHYRALTAVCRDWNDFQEQIALKLPPNEVLTGLCGAVAPQPLRSTMDVQSRKTPMLPGGLEQVFFKRATPSERNMNPFWVHWIRLW